MRSKEKNYAYITLRSEYVYLYIRDAYCFNFENMLLLFISPTVNGLHSILFDKIDFFLLLSVHSCLLVFF